MFFHVLKGRYTSGFFPCTNKVFFLRLETLECSAIYINRSVVYINSSAFYINRTANQSFLPQKGKFRSGRKIVRNRPYAQKNMRDFCLGVFLCFTHLYLQFIAQKGRAWDGVFGKFLATRPRRCFRVRCHRQHRALPADRQFPYSGG